jgi:hypothetical protein
MWEAMQNGGRAAEKDNGVGREFGREAEDTSQGKIFH